ncbi:MAG: polymer-forming cytoskeletal protein [Candidatus Falkowbacteria bacterium]
MKGKITKILIFLALILLPLGVTKAADTKTGDAVYVSKDEIVSGNLYAAGNSITIDGNISGDLIAAAQIITVNGRVEGDIIAAAQTITVNGEVGGNIRVAGSSITLNGPVERNVNAFASNIIMGATSKTGWDVFVAGATFESRGTINGSLSGKVGRALVSGKIAKNVNLQIAENSLSEGLIVSPDSSIGGSLTYSSKNTAQISEKAVVGGKIEQKIPESKNINWFALWAGTRIYIIFSALLVGLVLVLLGKKVTPKIIQKIEDKPFQALLPGLVIIFIIPPIALFLAFTVIGIPLALIVIALWFVAVFIAKIFTAILVGKIILHSLIKKHDIKLIWSLILGVIICYLLFAIPFVGWIISLIAAWLGLGGLWLYVTNQFRNL